MTQPKKRKENGFGEDHSRKAYKGIRRMLYYKELVPGQKVSCRSVAKKLGMSVTPVIQALKLMEFQGLVGHEANHGYFMTPFSIAEVAEIYEMRQLLEPSLVPAVVEAIDAEGKEILKNTLEAHVSAGKEEMFFQDRLFKNVEFHLALASLSKMETQIRILRQLYNLLFLKYGGNYLPVAFTRSLDGEHQKIYDAVCAKDVSAAQTALGTHIANVKESVLKSAARMSENVDVPEF
jgi:DNA-binding GntR family transcriptional regulator